MRICFVVEYYYPHVGGAEVLLQHLAEGLVRAGHDCTVVTCKLPGTSGHEVLNGVSIHRVAVPRRGDRYWFTLCALLPSLRYAGKADVIHTMAYNGAFPAKIASMLRRTPAVIHVFEVIREKWFTVGISRPAALLYRMLEYIVLRIPFDAYSCISKYTMQALEDWGIPAARLFLAYPGIDYGLFTPESHRTKADSLRLQLGLAADRFLYLYYGRPGYVKGVEDLVRAVPLLKQKIPGSMLLLLLSKKPEAGRKRVLDLIHTLGLESGKDVLLVDPVPRRDLPSYLLASDCVVVPSLSEGFGFSCAEACAMKRPVVATTAGSLPEVISGRHVLVEPASPEALAKGVIRISQGAYQQTDEKLFLWEDHVRKHENVYKKLIDGGTIS